MYSNIQPRFDTKLYLRSQEIERVKTVQYLGVTIDDRLSFIPHCNRAVIKSKQAIGALTRTFRKSAPTNVFIRVFLTCILPSLTHCAEIWYPSAVYAKSNAERVQRQMARFVTNNYILPYNNLLVILNWTPIWKQVLRRQLILYYKLYHQLHYAPRSCFPPAACQNTRTAHGETINLRWKKDTTGNLFFYRMATI